MTSTNILKIKIKEYLNGRNIHDIVKELNISESYFRTLVHMNNYRKMKKQRKEWTIDEIEYLKNNYVDSHIIDLCNYLNRPEISIRSKSKSVKFK